MNYIYIDSDDNKNKIAIIEDEELVEYYIEDKNKEKILGNIYRGRVENVLKGMQAAFVNIGVGKNAYLYLTDALDEKLRKAGVNHRIEDILKVGDQVIVQVIKEALGDKGAKVTRNLTFTGRYIVYTPFQSGINISRKIKNPSEIERLKAIGESFQKEGLGLIFRTVAKGVEGETIKEEFDSLLNIYEGIEREKNYLPTPKLIFTEMGLAYKIIRDNFKSNTYNIVVNDREIYEELLRQGENSKLHIKDKIRYDEDFDSKYNNIIDEGLKIGLSRIVNLESGGSIVIDKTEALTAIDVNTHKYVGTLSLKETVMDTNLEAAKEIARQMRLRNLGGIIIIDFIDMKSDRNVEELMIYLRECFTKDKNKPYIVDITKLGLVEVTRKRESEALEREILFICPTCQGRGMVKKKFIDK